VTWPRREDRALVHVLHALPDLPGSAGASASALLSRAELHGVAGVVHDALAEHGVRLSAELEAGLAARRIAREGDHEAHLAILLRIDEALARAGVRGVALKGALFAERFYARPSARATSDIDLMVDEAALEDAASALAEVGFARSLDPSEARFRREGHHLHFSHPHALPLELHFHAYRGFGAVLPSEPLIARSRPLEVLGHRALGVLAPDDELVYLAVHAAAHRFLRLGWLYDLKLLVATMSRDEIDRAARRAREWGYARVVGYAADLLIEVLGVSAAVLSPLRLLSPLRRPVVRRVTAEPRSPVARSATRFVYTALLCASAPAAVRYARIASRAYVDRLAGNSA
jgi:hypothetical protein